LAFGSPSVKCNQKWNNLLGFSGIHSNEMYMNKRKKEVTSKKDDAYV